MNGQVEHLTVINLLKNKLCKMTKGKLERQSSRYIFHSSRIKKDHRKASEILGIIIIEFYGKLKLILLFL